MTERENKSKKNLKLDIEEGSEHQINYTDENEEFEGKECCICKDIPDSIIFLSCNHIICLVCAARSILAEDDNNDIDFSKIVCEICGENTVLNQEV